MMFAAALVGILATMGLALARAATGPTVFDSILALNMFGTKTVLLIAVLRFSQFGHFADPDDEQGKDP